MVEIVGTDPIDTGSGSAVADTLDGKLQIAIVCDAIRKVRQDLVGDRAFFSATTQ